jgi:hypothetical protein
MGFGAGRSLPVGSNGFQAGAVPSLGTGIPGAQSATYRPFRAQVQYSPVAQKKLPKPAWYKNTYFWIAGILLILSIVGFIGGNNTIRDPGQRREPVLPLLYLVASAVMLVNGLMSHSQTVQHYNESLEGTKEE